MKWGFLILGTLLLLTATSVATEGSAWSMQVQNPMADVMKLPIGNQFNQGVGHKSGTEYTLSLNPSMPSDLSENWILINRLDIPFIYQPGLAAGQQDAHGLGDIQYESFYGPAGKRTVYWGVGPLFEIPSATDSTLGSKKWSAGLGGIGIVEKGSFVGGVRANHLRSFAGGGSKPDVDRTTLEYFAHWNFARGWSIGTAPVNIANWEASADETWTIPIGGGIGKTVMNGRMPIHFTLEAYHYLEQPSSGADWQLTFEIHFLFPEDALFKK